MIECVNFMETFKDFIIVYNKYVLAYIRVSCNEFKVTPMEELLYGFPGVASNRICVTNVF
jgi:hypothetical protein